MHKSWDVRIYLQAFIWPRYGHKRLVSNRYQIRQRVFLGQAWASDRWTISRELDKRGNQIMCVIVQIGANRIQNHKTIEKSKTGYKIVMWRPTPRLRSLYKKKNDTSHIEALYRSLIRFAKSAWFMTSKASFTWESHDCFSICFKRSEPQRCFLYIILHYNVLALFSFYPNLYIMVKLTLPMK